MQDNDVEENAEDDEEDEEEEESPPFEPHSENDRLILGIRTDSSDDSCDNQVVTTVVDDDLEERIDKEDKMGKENNNIKEEDDEEEESSSDEYVPKTPTINMEVSDGTVIEFNSISEYRQYQTKFDEENFGDVEEEVVCSQWTDESSSHMKEERSSNEEDTVRGSRKRKLHNNSFDDASNSSVDKGSTSDECGTSTAIDVCRKRLKFKDGHESEIEKESTSDEEKVIRSNSNSTKKQQLEEYQRESETEKGITSDEEQTLKSNYFSDKKMIIEENESEIEKGNTSDEDKSHYFSNSKSKLEEDRDGSETEKDNTSDEGKSNDFDPNEMELVENECLKEKDSRLLAEFNEDSNYSNPEQFFDLVEPKSSQVVCNLKEKHKSSSSSSKDSERSHRHRGKKESSSHHRRLKDKVDDEDNKKEGSVSSNSSKDRHDSSRDRHKTRERKKSESSFSHSKSKHHDKNRDTPDNDRNSKDSIESDLRHKHHKDRPRDHDKEKKKHDSHDKNSERKKDHDPKYFSKHGLISEKHSHRSSSERHKSDKEHKPRESSDKHSRHDKKSDKDNKQESKKRHRERCKTSKNNESRRSTDRDSNGPSGRGHTSSSSKSSSTKSNVETSVDSGERTSSNSDNTVSDNVEVLHSDCSKVIALNTEGIASPDHEMVEDSWVESDNISSDQNDNSHDSYNTDQQLSDSSFEVKDGRISRSGKTGEYNRESGDESEARRNIDEAELVQFESVDVVKVAESASSTHDNSSEKENIELTLDTSGNLSSPDSEGNVVKFKKPKIAANIYEVKKIMLARRKMKHMEKKRMKLMTKTTEQFPSNNCKDESQEEFKGFGEILSDKKERYDVLIQRLTSEIESDEITSVSPNLTTSWIDVSPDLDDYIENTLKGKVHRKIRVRLPPISDVHYRYDSELNAYILLDTGEELPLTREEKVDGNLNNLEPNFENKEMLYDTLSIEGHADCTFNGSNSKPRNKNCILNPLQCDSETSVKTEDALSGISKIQNHNLPQTSKEITSKQESEMKTCDVSALVSTKSNTSNSIIAKPKVLFSLTYNETYKEILKEKNEAPIRTKTPQTVVKITNDRLSEQVVVKTVQQTSRQKYPLPTITKSEPRVNGQISKSNPTQNQTPLISRITKSKNIKGLSSSTTKSSPVNGNISPDFTIKFEVRVLLYFKVFFAWNVLFPSS